MRSFSPTGRMLTARGAYLRLLSERRSLTEVSLSGLAPEDQPILLKDIYVPVHLSRTRLDEDVAEGVLQENGRPVSVWLRDAEELKSPGLVFVSGAAGSGKTTLSRALVEGFVRGGVETLGPQFRDTVPFPIFLRDAPLQEFHSLERLIDWWLDRVLENAPADLRFDRDALKQFLEAGRGLILLDGFDEVGEREPRQRLLSWLGGHPWLSPGRDGLGANWAFLTGRPSGFEGLETKHLPVVGTLHVAPFTREQIQSYLERWFRLRPVEQEERERTVQELLARLDLPDERTRLLPLARRPAYLAALAFVHGTRGKLPHTRAALYELLVDAYLEALDQSRKLHGQQPKPWDRQEKIDVLAEVACRAHEGETKSKAADPLHHFFGNRRFQWTRAELEETVESVVAARIERLRTIQRGDAKELTRYFIARTGLLAEVATNVFQFAHLSIQEYLTALYLLNEASAEDNKAEALKESLLSRFGQAGWEEVGLLLLSIDAARTGGRGHEAILARLDPKKPAHVAFLAAALAEREIRFTEAERQSWLSAWALAWVCQEEVNLGPRDRALAADMGPSVLTAARIRLLEAWLGGTDPISGLRGISKTKGCQWFAERVEPPEDRDQLLANIISLIPLPESSRTDGALPLLVAACAFLEFSPCVPGDLPLVPKAWLPLFARGFLDPDLGYAIARATPLVWWTIATPLISFACQQQDVSSDAIATWRAQVARRSFQFEGAFWRCVGVEKALSLNLAWLRAHGPDMEEYLDFDFELEGGFVRGGDWDVAAELDLARTRALSLGRNVIEYCDRDLDLELPLEPATRLAAMLGAESAPHSGTLGRLLASAEVQSGPLSDAVLLAVAALHGGLAAVGLGGRSAEVFRREELAAEREAWRRGEIPGEPPVGIVEQASRECLEVRDAYLSPLPWLDVTLGLSWDEFELSAEAVVRQFNATLEALLAEVEDAYERA